MNSGLLTFDFAEQAVRVIGRGEELLWVAADVCRALEILNVSQACGQLDSDDLCSTEVIDSMGRVQKANVLTESGLYSLIFTSRKEKAQVFKRWVTKEVLPSIRKTGRYALAEAAEPENAVDGLIEAGERAAVRVSDVVNHPDTPRAEILSGAATLATLLQECRKLHAMRHKATGVPEVPALTDSGDSMRAVLGAYALKLAGDSEARVGELMETARELGRCGDAFAGGDDAAFKCFGRRLQSWLGVRLEDSNGRAFVVRRRRTKHGARYHFNFLDERRAEA